jgi:hypothetical protein
MWPWRKNPGNVVGTHPVPVRWAAGEEGSPAGGGRAVTQPGTPARSPYPAGICPAQGGKKQQCCGSVTFWHRILIFGSVTVTPTDPRMRILAALTHRSPTDPDPDPHPDPEHWYIYIILQR